MPSAAGHRRRASRHSPAATNASRPGRPIRFHDLRHSTATLLLEQGVELVVIKELLDHAHIGVTATVYAHVRFASSGKPSTSSDMPSGPLPKPPPSPTTATPRSLGTVYFGRSTTNGTATVIRMEPFPDTVLIFDRDEDLLVFESFVHATNWIEAIDVEEGEYTAAYSPDGGVLALTAPEGPEGSVALARTGSVDLGDLERRVARYWRRHQAGKPTRAPLRTARFLIERDNKPRGGWPGRVNALLRRGTAGTEPTPSPRSDFTAQGDGSR